MRSLLLLGINDDWIQSRRAANMLRKSIKSMFRKASCKMGWWKHMYWPNHNTMYHIDCCQFFFSFSFSCNFKFYWWWRMNCRDNYKRFFFYAINNGHWVHYLHYCFSMIFDIKIQFDVIHVLLSFFILYFMEFYSILWMGSLCHINCYLSRWRTNL